MQYWITRNHAKTRFHVSFEPPNQAWPGWDLRTGKMTKKRAAEFSAYPIDPIRLEVIHQEAWADARPLALASTGEVPSTE